jgi:hypothetical protein
MVSQERLRRVAGSCEGGAKAGGELKMVTNLKTTMKGGEARNPNG